jgi:4'-phosphopantetheinyl transferase
MFIRYLNLPCQISLTNIPNLWEQNDILILVVDLDNYNVLSTEYLDENEKEERDIFKTSYFKKRYIVSRKVLKYIIYCLFKEQSISTISTYKDEYGKVHVRGHEDLHICLSYAGNIASLAISKIKVGIDIELEKLFPPKKIFRYLHKPILRTKYPENDHDLLIVWTLKEAYSKFSNKSMLVNLNKELDLSSVFHSSYILNEKYILSVITCVNPHDLNISFLPKITFNNLNYTNYIN